MEFTIKMEDKAEVDRLLTLARIRNEYGKEEMDMLFRGVSIGELIAGRKLREERGN